MMNTQQQVPTEGMMTNNEPLSYSFENEYTMEDYCSTCSDDHIHHRIVRNQTTQELNIQQHTLVQKDFMPTFYNPFETKHRRRTSRAQFKTLEASFSNNTKPNATMRRWLAQKLDMTPRSVQVWFQNRRAKAKSQLKRQHSSSSSFNHALIDSPVIEYSNTDNSGTLDDNVATMDHGSCGCHPPFTPSFYPTKDVLQMQWQQPISYDPLSVLMDHPDLMSWYSSSPISSPLPSLSPPNYQQMDSASAVSMTFSPSNSSTVSSSSSSPPYHRRSSFPVAIDLDNKDDTNLRRLSEPIFDLHPPFMMMMDLPPSLNLFQSGPFV